MSGRGQFFAAAAAGLAAVSLAAYDLRTAGVEKRPAVAVGAVRAIPASLPLGVGRPGEELRGSFRLVNESEGAVPFRLSRSCSCATLTPEDGVLPPRGSAEVRTSVRMPNVSGGRTTSRIGVLVAGAEVASVSVSGECPRLFNGPSRAVRFGRPGSEAEPVVIECVADGLTFQGLERPVESATSGVDLQLDGRGPTAFSVAIVATGDPAVELATLRVAARDAGGEVFRESLVVRNADVGSLVLAPRVVRIPGDGRPVSVVARASDGRSIRFVGVKGKAARVSGPDGFDRVRLLSVFGDAEPGATRASLELRFESETGEVLTSAIEVVSPAGG